MINARSLATLGIGFGVVAITTLGIISDGQIPQVNNGGGGNGTRRGAYVPERQHISGNDNDLIMLVALAFMETRTWEV